MNSHVKATKAPARMSHPVPFVSSHRKAPACVSTPCVVVNSHVKATKAPACMSRPVLFEPVCHALCCREFTRQGHKGPSLYVTPCALREFTSQGPSLYVTPCALREFTSQGPSLYVTPCVVVNSHVKATKAPACMSRPVPFVSSHRKAPACMSCPVLS